MKLNEAHDYAKTTFQIASLVSIFVLFSSGILFCMIAEDIEQFGRHYKDETNKIDTMRIESHDIIDYKMREKRQSFFQRRNHNFNTRHKLDSRNGDSPKICDCTVIQCPRGARGPPGSDGDSAEDGLPGKHGKPGMDGIFLVEEIQCPPCPQGPKGPDGDQGEKGEPGKSGIPGMPGHDGTNEPGPMGEPGNRGQSGRPGKKGPTGEPGQDAVQLIGVPGPKGPDGPPGFPGSRGDSGENGAPAPPGPEGLSGPQGEPGEDGEYGVRGVPGRKGPPGLDGGYCNCPPREGSGIASVSGSDNLPLTWEEYRRGTIRTAAVPATESRTQYSRKFPGSRQPHLPDSVARITNLPDSDFSQQLGQATEEEDTYPRAPLSHYGNRPQYIEVRQAKISHSPMIPLIDYKDSREGVNNRVVMSTKNRNRAVVRGSSVDFDLRRRL